MISVVRRFRVRGGVETLSEATRVYQRLTRREPGNVRCELWQTAGDEQVRDDTWAGAALGCFRLSAASSDRRARFHTAAEDGKNDWLMTLRCRVA